MNNRAGYGIHELGNLLVLVDHNEGARSLTNDAENVVADLVAMGYAVDDFVIVYRDSMGRWDQIVTEGAQFQRFYPLVNKLVDA